MDFAHCVEPHSPDAHHSEEGAPQLTQELERTRAELDETKAELDRVKASLNSSDTFVGVFLDMVTFISQSFCYCPSVTPAADMSIRNQHFLAGSIAQNADRDLQAF